MGRGGGYDWVSLRAHVCQRKISLREIHHFTNDCIRIYKNMDLKLIEKAIRKRENKVNMYLEDFIFKIICATLI